MGDVQTAKCNWYAWVKLINRTYNL